jgi:hypothetical protein
MSSLVLCNGQYVVMTFTHTITLYVVPVFWVVVSILQNNRCLIENHTVADLGVVDMVASIKTKTLMIVCVYVYNCTYASYFSLGDIYIYR